MTGSVRGRLTMAVVVVVGAIAVVLALVAPRRVEQSLIDDRLDAEVDAEAEALRSRVRILASDGSPLGAPELTALLGPDIAALATTLDDAGALTRLRALRADRSVVVTPVSGVLAEVAPDGRIRVAPGTPDDADGPVLTGARFEQLAEQLDPASVFDSPLDVIADGDTLRDILRDLEERFESGEFDLGDLDLGDLDLGELGDLGSFEDRILDQLPGDLFDVPESSNASTSPRTVDELVLGVRRIDGIPVVVSTSGDGIDITTDRLRDALWIAVPIAMLLTGSITWLLAGRALRPVRAITDQTARIRAGTLHERVPVPSSHDEVADLAAEMNDMLDRLEAEDRRRRQFIADASHELRSPIASIHTQAEVALRADRPDRAEGVADGGDDELAAGVLAEAERLRTIVDDLLALARHDETLLPPGSIVDLDDLVLADAARSRRVPVSTSSVSAGRVRGRPDELARVVTHLLDNATRHAERSVRVSLRTVDDRVLLAVDDDGPGVPDADRNRIFDRFVRLDDARARDHGGAGLGLSVVDSVVRAAGGTVTVDEGELGGARFVVDLPAVA